MNRGLAKKSPRESAHAGHKDSGDGKSRGREALGILLLCFTVFLLFALVTFDPADWPNSSRAYGQATGNKAGAFGALVSWVMVTAFGFTSYALLGLVAVTAGVLFLHRPLRIVLKPAVILIVFGLFGPLLAGLVTDTGASDTLVKPAYRFGGIMGGMTAGALVGWLGKVGAYLTAIGAMLVTLVLTTALKPSSIVEGIVGLFRRDDRRDDRRDTRRGRAVVEDEEPDDDFDRESDEEPFDADEDDDPFLTPVEGIDEEDPEARRPAVRPAIVDAVRSARRSGMAEGAAIQPAGHPHRTYMLPGSDLLDRTEEEVTSETREDMLEKAQRIVECLRYFNIETEVRQITPGPIITRYELTLAPGVKVGKVVNLSDDLAMALKAKGGIRILAPIPGKAAIGIEVPNKTRSMVSFREIVESDAFAAADQPLILALGKNTSGDPIAADLEKMPHLLIAGSTGSGKSICINTLITSILMKAEPERVRMILVDPKVVELSVYNTIPHLLTPVITDPKRAGEALQWAVREMERRYRLLATVGVRDIGQYNRKARSFAEGATLPDGGEPPTPIPFIVVIIDEFADLMMIAANEIEESIARLAQMARAVGIHLVLATQRPSADVITGLIKANFPSRIAFKVMQAANSRIILDQNGADKLLGMGDMLFLQAGKPEPVRLHGAFISGEESQRVVDYIASQSGEEYERITEEIFAPPAADDDGNAPGLRDPHARDPLFWEAARLVVRHNQGSVSLLQRRLKVGYARAARLIDQLEIAGVVSPYDGSKAREVMVDDRYLDDMEAEGL